MPKLRRNRNPPPDLSLNPAPVPNLAPVPNPVLVPNLALVPNLEVEASPRVRDRSSKTGSL